MRMNQPEAFHLLRTAIRLCRQHGTLLPSADQVCPRFIAVTEGEIAPLVRHLGHVLRQEGFEASEVFEMNGESPYVGLRLQEPRITMWIWPEDALTVNMSVERLGDAERNFSQSFSYEAINGGGLLRPIQEWIIHALDPRQGAKPPI